MERQVNVSESVFSCVEQDSMGSVLSLFVAGRECVALLDFCLCVWPTSMWKDLASLSAASWLPLSAHVTQEWSAKAAQEG